jgi:hypothetical protein
MDDKGRRQIHGASKKEGTGRRVENVENEAGRIIRYSSFIMITLLLPTMATLSRTCTFSASQPFF